MKRAMKRPNIGIAAVVFGVLLASGCSTLDVYEPNRETLASALGDLESGEPAKLERAEASARSILVSTGNVPKSYSVQRFFAQYLLARLHMTASSSGPFLQEPKEKDAFDLTAGASFQPSPIGHLVATSYHAAYGLGMFKAASGQPLSVGKQKLLPPELEALGVENAARHLQLCLIAVYARLQFDDLTNLYLNRIGATDAEALDRLLVEGDASLDMKLWIYRAMWLQLKKNDPQAAYLFAANCLASADDLGQGTDHVHAKAISSWFAENSSKFNFVCPTCKNPVTVESRTCLACVGSEWKDAVYQEVKAEVSN